jgi:hypothetical protein
MHVGMWGTNYVLFWIVSLVSPNVADEYLPLERRYRTNFFCSLSGYGDVSFRESIIRVLARIQTVQE